MNAIREHPIGVVIRRTGLSPHVIRIWERRYGAVKPARTETNRRIYSDEDIQRLSLLKKATSLGRSIGQVAELSDRELRRLVNRDLEEIESSGQPPQQRGEPDATRISAAAADLRRGFMQAVDDFDVVTLRKILLQAKVELGQRAATEEFIPLVMTEVGDRWAHGSLRVFQEHVAAETVKTFLGEILASMVAPQGSPTAVAALPARQIHELGLLVSAIAASSDGWNVTYLGADSPSEEIARAAELCGARAVLLSITFPQADFQLLEELRHLSAALSPETSILVGGRVAEGYVEKLGPLTSQTRDSRNLIHVADMSALHGELARLR